MKRLASVLFLAGALACGSADEKQGCSTSNECPVGEYCARSGSERRCWPDAVAPAAAVVSAACTPAPCRRDGVLHVVATVTDDSEVLGASVSLDLDPSQAFPMSPSAGQWVADVPLRALPFEAFSRDVVPTVVGRDGARNASAAASGAGVNVTRLRWTYDAGAPLTAPAVMADGTVILGVSATADQVLAVNASGVKAWSQTVGGTSFVTAAPAIGGHAIWVGSESGVLYAVELDGSAVMANVGVDVGGPIKGSVALKTELAKDTGFATCKKADNTGWIGVASTVPTQFDVSSAPDGFASGPVIGIDELIHGSTATGTNDATLRTFALTDIPFALSAYWTATLGKGSLAPSGIDGSGAIVSPSDESTPTLKRTVPGASPVTDTIGTLTAFAGVGAIVLANGDVVIGDENGRLHRFGSSGPVWSVPPNLASAVRGSMVLSGTASPLLVATNAGKVFALRDDGTTAWEGTLASATQLRPPNVHTPSGQPAGPVMSTAYLSSGNGRLYAVIVDGQLDGSAPWPKAFHDPRNTNHAGPQP